MNPPTAIHERRTGRLRVLAVGAHADDVELGAGALLRKLVEEGHEVHLLVLTDDAHRAALRRAEAVAAAAELGVLADRVLFAGQPDGRLRVDAPTVRQLRSLTVDRPPDLVVTHTESDSHNDHVEANRCARAAFRDALFLHFAVHVSGEPHRFAPRVFVEVTRARGAAKRRALAAHSSQRDTIHRYDLDEAEARAGFAAGMCRAEGFEVGVQTGSLAREHALLALSESSFHRLWAGVLAAAGGRVELLYPSTAGHPDPGRAESQLNRGRDRLRAAFADGWPGLRWPLREVEAASGALPTGRGTVLVGGPGGNAATRALTQRLGGLRWWPDDSAAAVLDRHRGGPVLPAGRAGRPVDIGPVDVGVLTRVVEPERVLLLAAGATAHATAAALEALAEPDAHPELAGELLAAEGTVEVLFAVDAAGATRVLDRRHPTTAALAA